MSGSLSSNGSTSGTLVVEVDPNFDAAFSNLFNQQWS